MESPAGPRSFLFTGKGGAGKTTCACAFALAVASEGRKVYLASLDGAHNLGDVLDLSLSDDPRPVTENLRAREVDLETHIQAKIRRTRALIEERYRYLTVAAMDPLVRLLGEAPGTEEQAAAEVLGGLLREASEREETLVVDLPPSGQALRLLALPALMVRWCDALLRLRRRILERRGTLGHILDRDSPARDTEGGALPEDPARDPVFQSLDAARTLYEGPARALADRARARIVAVTISERTALLETRRLREGLGRRGIPVSHLVLNRAAPDAPPRLEPDPGLVPSAILPDLPEEPRGLFSLTRLAQGMKRLRTMES